MKTVAKLFLKGFLTILPIVLTFTIIVWLCVKAESYLKPVIMFVIPGQFYIPGLGIVLGFAGMVFVGLVVNAWLFRKVDEKIQYVFKKIPLVSVIYNSIKDVADFMLTANENRNLDKVVIVNVSDDIKVMGFVTQKSLDLGSYGNKVAVYIPMSFQVGGYTILTSESQLEYLDMEANEAMRMILTGGLKR